MAPRRSSPPPWFVVCVAVALGLALRAWVPPGLHSAGGDGHTPPALLAFWVLFAAVVGAIWKGLEIAGKIALEALVWSVKALWWFAGQIANGVKALGQGILAGLRGVWGFFRAVYEDVLKPAWQKFWSWFEKARKWLQDTFGPLLKHLRDLRDAFLCFWKTYVRPWLDLLDITRRALRVAAALGLTWARQLDAWLGTIEDAIEKPFRFVLAKLNEIINLVNRVVTADGLFQRVAMIRSLERDYQFAWRVAMNPWAKETEEQKAKRKAAKKEPKTLDVIVTETSAYMRDGGGPRAALYDEQLAQWRIYLRN